MIGYVSHPCRFDDPITRWSISDRCHPIVLDRSGASVMVTHDPRQGKSQCILVAPTVIRSVWNLLPLYSPYILTHSAVQLYLYIICLWSSIRVCAFTQSSIFQLSDMVHSEGYMSFTPLIKKWHNWQNMHSLHSNCTINHLVCLLKTLPEFNCGWLLHVGALITHDLLTAGWPQFAPD